MKTEFSLKMTYQKRSQWYNSSEKEDFAKMDGNNELTQINLLLKYLNSCGYIYEGTNGPNEDYYHLSGWGKSAIFYFPSEEELLRAQMLL